MKRQQQRQGQVDAEVDGTAAAIEESQAPKSRSDRPEKSGMSPPARVGEFFHEVRSELRQVAWPTRSEVANSATVVFITLVLLVVLIFLLNYAFSHSISWLYTT
jgi:preprotein translocase subunit SecE